MSVPPFNPLHVFVVAARAGSFSRAADVLNVSQSAVSRQVAVLEGYVGARLFVRERHGLSLTEVGEALQRDVAPAFQQIAAATDRLRRSESADPLRLRVYNTFAMKWLLPRLGRFEALHPGIAVELSHAVAPVDFDRDGADVAIQFGDRDWPGLEAHLLLADVIQPVCSPRLLVSGPPLREPDHLRHHRLLVSRYRRDDWKDWLRVVGRLDLARDGMEFASSVLTYQAAVEGLGVAMGQVQLLAEEIRNGQLVALFERPVERPLGHYVVWPAGRLDRKGRAFVGWLRAEIGS